MLPPGTFARLLAANTRGGASKLGCATRQTLPVVTLVQRRDGDGALAVATTQPAAVHRASAVSRIMRGRFIVPALFILPVVIYALAFFAYPLVFGIIMSVEQFGFAALVHGSGPFVGLANYRAAFDDPTTILALRNTLIFTVFSVGFQVGIGLAIAVLLNRPFLLSGLLRRLVLIPWLIPLLATGTIFSLLFGLPERFYQHAPHAPPPDFVPRQLAR